jgi:hypothetical protein
MAIGVASVVSGVGRGAPTAALEASWTSRYWPGARVTSGSSVSWPALAPRFPVPVGLAYCSDQPPTEAGLVPRLNSSTKSWVNGALEFPPPPSTWLTTMLWETAAAGTPPAR